MGNVEAGTQLRNRAGFGVGLRADSERGMMEKPRPKKEVAIQTAIKTTRTIFFFASKDAIEEFKDFGHISQDINGGLIVLNVDMRYDFDEVVNYIENYG